MKDKMMIGLFSAIADLVMRSPHTSKLIVLEIAFTR